MKLISLTSVILLYLTPIIHPVPIKPEANPKAPNYLLPDNVLPEFYNLELTVYLDKLQDARAYYDGHVDITLRATEDGVSSVSLNLYDNIEIVTAQLIKAGSSNNTSSQDGNSNKLKPAADDNLLADGNPAYDLITEILTFNLKEGSTLSRENEYILKLDFHAEHRDDDAGFYRSSYSDSDRNIHQLVTTDLEPTSARSVLPCFDEPHFKANYSIKVKVGTDFVNNKGYHVLGNTPVQLTTVDGDFTIFQLEPTPKKIATYLLAIIVSDFKGSEKAATFNGDKPFKTWGQAKYLDNNEDQLSQIAGPAVLDLMTKKVGIVYGYQKLDQAGIPDFAAGAMENWGLVTYQEYLLFFDEENDSENAKENVVMVTAHELAHQWFGDLVTLHSWDDIWLNEGFADFYEYHATAEIDVPGLNATGWGDYEYFVIEELQGAFSIDGYDDTRPLTSPTYGNPSIASDNFDPISYSKGGSVIRMWNHILGDKIFYSGLNKYLTANQEENGTPEELLQAFEDATAEAPENERPILPDGITVSEAFADWHLQPGYPVLNVIRTGSNTYNLTQERFFYNEGNEDGTTWHIPITYSTSDNRQFEKTSPVAWLRKDDKSGVLTVGPEGGPKPDWIIVNNRETGYYRVNYDSENWETLMDIVFNNPDVMDIIDPINQAQIVDDYYSLGRSTKKHYLDYSLALSFTRYLVNVRHYAPWSAASNHFDFLNTKLSNDATYKFLRQYILELVEPHYKELGLKVDATKDSHTLRLFRILIANWACKLSHKQCIADAQDLYQNDAIPADVKSIVYCSVVRNGDQSVFENIKAKYIASNNKRNQIIYLSALGCSKDETLLSEMLLETIKAESIIRKQDLSSAFSSVINGNPENVKMALAFLQKHLDDIANMYRGRNPIGAILVELANKVVADEDIKTLNLILDAISTSQKPKVKAAARKVPLARNVVADTQSWKNIKRAPLTSWLKKNYGGVSMF